MKQLHNLYSKILTEGYRYTDASRDVGMIEIPSHTLKFDLTKGFPAVTTKKLYWKGIVGELIWFLRGDTNIKYLVDNGINIWNKDAYNWYKKHMGKHDIDNFISHVGHDGNNGFGYRRGDVGRNYGAQWRDWNEMGKGQTKSSNGTLLSVTTWDGVDQITDLITNLNGDRPMNRRNIVTAWNPAEIDDTALPSCHWAFEIISRPLPLKHYEQYCKDTGLVSIYEGDGFTLRKHVPKYGFTLKWHQRSCDSFLGIPFNIASYALLAHIIGKLTNMVPLELIGDLSCVHIYEPHEESVREQLTREPYELPTLEIDSEALAVISKDRDPRYSLTEVFNHLNIDWFKLNNYKSHPALKEEMIAPK
jgi:thymidylate synthase